MRHVADYFDLYTVHLVRRACAMGCRQRRAHAIGGRRRVADLGGRVHGRGAALARAVETHDEPICAAAGGAQLMYCCRAARVAGAAASGDLIFFYPTVYKAVVICLS